jgi:hypothetical protein
MITTEGGCQSRRNHCPGVVLIQLQRKAVMHFAHIMLLRHQARPPETKLRAGVDWIKTNGFACKIEGLLCPRQFTKNSRVAKWMMFCALAGLE